MQQQHQELNSHAPQLLELLTQAEAAKMLRISQRNFQRLEELGDGPPRTRLSDRRVAYPRDGLVAWVIQRTTVPRAA
jgi:predicted DNA-binding transcriptional regulator AlpA